MNAVIIKSRFYALLISFGCFIATAAIIAVA